MICSINNENHIFNGRLIFCCTILKNILIVQAFKPFKHFEKKFHQFFFEKMLKEVLQMLESSSFFLHHKVKKITMKNNNYNYDRNLKIIVTIIVIFQVFESLSSTFHRFHAHQTDSSLPQPEHSSPSPRTPPPPQKKKTRTHRIQHLPSLPPSFLSKGDLWTKPCFFFSNLELVKDFLSATSQCFFEFFSKWTERKKKFF